MEKHSPHLTSEDEKALGGDIAEGTQVSKDVESIAPIDHVAEAKLIRKLDLMIVPPVMLLYLFSFLDRVSNTKW